MSDPTGLSCDFVVNQFSSEQSSNTELSPAQFFQNNAHLSANQFALDVVETDIRSRINDGKTVDLDSYLQQFSELRTHPGAWRILQAAEPWLVENEGVNWQQRWLNEFPLLEPSRFQRESTRLPFINTVADPELLNPDDRVLDFEIIKLLGRGTYGVVHLARNLVLGREVALKITPQSGNEGRALARLNHPNIVRVFGQHEWGAKRMLEMEYIKGGVLSDWLVTKRSPNPVLYRDWVEQNGVEQNGVEQSEVEPNEGGQNQIAQSEVPSQVPEHLRKPAEVAVWITLQLANGLQHAHQRGVLHQDIKPANVLINAQGIPLLTDFNVAFIDGQSGDEGIGGTLNYMPPEQLRAFCSGDCDLVSAIDLRADIYSLGVVLLELLGGSKVWGETASETIESLPAKLLPSRQMSSPPAVSDLPGVNRTLAAIVEKALKPRVEDRYQSASEFATDLSNFLAGRSNDFAGNPSHAERLMRLGRRNKLAAIASLMSVVFVVAGVFGWSASEKTRLDKCSDLLAEVDSSIKAGRTSHAAEQLGVAKSQIGQLWISRWLNSGSLQANVAKAESCSEQLKRIEEFRFSSLFGQASLLSIHHEQQGDSQQLVEESLKTYGITSNPHWQQQAPFVDLASRQQAQVAENITELMLVSMILSSNKSFPSDQQWVQVLERLPAEHADLSIFKRIKQGESPPTHSSQREQVGLLVNQETCSSFERYLYGVWSTCLRDDVNARAWYKSSLQSQAAATGEKFWLRYRAGLSAQRLGKHQEAIGHYHVCLGMKPDFAWLPFNIALVNIETGQKSTARKLLRRAIHLDSKLSAAYQVLVGLQFESGEFELVLETCEQANKAGVSTPELRQQRNMVLARQTDRGN